MRTSSESTAAQAAGLADDYHGIGQTTRILAEPLSATNADLQSVSVHGRPSHRLLLALHARSPFTGIRLAKDTVKT